MDLHPGDRFQLHYPLKYSVPLPVASPGKFPDGRGQSFQEPGAKVLSAHQKDVEQAVDRVDAAIHDILASRSPAVQDLERAVRELGQALAPHYGARLALTLTLVDAVRTQSLPIPVAIYQTDGARSPRDVTEDSLPQRFVLLSLIHI